MTRFPVLALLASCTIETGYEPPPPPPWGVPLTGGTMTVTRDDTRAVIADPDRDRVVMLDLASEQVIDVVALAAGSEPGRVIEDGVGRIHVVLRGSGQLLTLTGTVAVWRSICGEPRGLAWQETGDLVHVACATGEVVSVPAGGGEPVRVVRLDRDLRDVVVRDSGLVVTTFRTAELLELDTEGVLITRTKPPLVKRSFELDASAIPEVAWRTIALPDGRIAMSHQRRLTARLTTDPGGYGGGCSDVIESSLTVVGTDGTVVPVAPVVHGALPVDIAVSPNGSSVALVTAGRRGVTTFPTTKLITPDPGQSCSFPSGTSELPVPGSLGMPTAVAWRPSGALIVFYPEDSSVLIPGRGIISLGGAPATDEGRALFHRQTSAGIACASCHPEARDDGAVWTFDSLGARRTQNLAGGILHRAPYHWGGDMESLPVLVDDVFASRMAGGDATDEEKRALGAWLDRVPAPRGVMVDYEAALRGEQLFQSPELGCIGCHNGPLLTNNQLANVGTGGRIKVPTLVGVGARAPYLHDGCATTLRDRFTTCGGGDYHGHTSQLSDAELTDLIAYLESL